MSGEWDLHRVIIFEFPDHEAVRATFSDPEYLPMIAIRERSAHSKAFMVDGVLRCRGTQSSERLLTSILESSACRTSYASPSTKRT